MEKEYLRLTIDADSDGTGALTAEIASSGFVAHGTAYFDLQHIANFSKALRAFPLSQNDPPIIEGGSGARRKPVRSNSYIFQFELTRSEVRDRLECVLGSRIRGFGKMIVLRLRTLPRSNCKRRTPHWNASEPTWSN